MAEKSSDRLVRTGFYSDKVANILSAFIKRFNDDHASCKRTFKLLSMRSIGIERTPDNEVCIACSTYRRHYNDNLAFNGWSNAEILNFVGWCLKCTTYEIINAFNKKVTGDACKLEWKRSSTQTINFDKSYFLANPGVVAAINEVYFIYDSFLERKAANKYYSSELVSSLRGVARDPVMTELIIANKEERARLKQNLTIATEAFRRKCREEKDAASKEIDEKYNKLINAVSEEYTIKLATLEKEVNEILHS